LAVLVAAGLSFPGAGKEVTPKDSTDRRIRLMGDALGARDRGDLLAAQKAIAELSELSPKDPTVQRLRAEIENQIASMNAATAKIATGTAPRPEEKIEPDGSIAVQFDKTPSQTELKKLAGNRVSFFATRGFVGTEGKIMRVKFTVDGEKPRLVLIRGIGPGLKTPNLKRGFLTEPLIELIDNGDAVIKANSDWKQSGSPAFIAAMVASAGGAPFDEVSKDAAIVTTLNPGNYAVRFSGLQEKTGIGLVEIYQFNP
jgi:hypothetical protein